jgi:ABC-2 type transport system permease protein
MTANTFATRTTALPPAKGRAGFGGALASEWTKFRSVRSTMWILLTLFVLTIGISALGSHGQANNLPTNNGVVAYIHNTRDLEFGTILGQLVVIVLGAIGVASEYSSGMIRTTLSVQPRRGTIYFAKLLILAASTFVVGEIIAFVSFFIGKSFFSSQGIEFSLSNTATLMAVIGAGGYLTGCALLAFGLGALFRNTAAGIAVPVAMLLVVDILVNAALPSTWQVHVDRYVPMEAGFQMWSTVHQPGQDLSAWNGFGVFMIYVVAALAAGFWSFTQRDA